MTLRLLGALALVLALPAAAQAQAAFKVGYIDTDQVVIRMPEFAQVQTQLGQEQTTVGTRVRFVQDSLNTILQTQLAASETFRTSALATADARRERETELLQLQGRIEQAQQQGLQYLSYVEARLLQPVLNRVDEAIQAEAAAQSIDLVLPTVANNAPVFLYASDRIVNVTEAVMRRLGIDPASPPPAGVTAPGASSGAPGVAAPGGN
jgi:outer membrane protein